MGIDSNTTGGRPAIVVGVGASAGLGAAAARRAARGGLQVLIAGRTPERLDRVAEEIGSAGGSAHPVPCDATDPGAVRALFQRCDELGGPPELVVYNAGNNHPRPFREMDAAFFESVWRLGCLGGFLVGQEAAARMVPAGGGTLIFTGATASLRSRPPFVAFASAKAALRAVAAGMARELGPEGLHVAHVVIDGVIDGDQIRSRFPAFAAQRGEAGMLDPDEIAETYWQLHRQHPTTWTFELDLRPAVETF